jgi:hypothetical protein
MTPASAPLPNRSCPLCGGENDCAAAITGRHDPGCWCTTVVAAPEALARVPPEWRDRACLCRQCLAGESTGRA